MTTKNKLIQEIEESSDEIIEELLNFLLLIKNRKNNNQKQTRPDGLCKGEFVTPSNFDDPLPDEIIKQFE